MDIQGWRLSVDFGTSHTVAVCQRPDGIASPLMFDGSPLLPSGVFAGPTGLLTGTEAERAAAENPAGYEPCPKRRVDDGTVRLGDREIAAVDLIGAVLARVAGEAYRASGAAPTRVVLTHPVSWSPARLATLAEAARRAGLAAVSLLPEPVAAAAYFSMVLHKNLPSGRCVLVCDLGAGTFDVSVVRQTPQGFQVVAGDGIPDFGVPHTDGADVDGAAAGQQPDRAVALTLATLQSAGVPREGVEGLFLVGASSRIPAVADVLQRGLGIAPTTVEHPELVVAQGGLCLAPPVPSPAGAVPPGVAPPGAVPPSSVPPYVAPPGAISPGVVPPGAMPPGAMPSGAMPSGAMPPGAMPPVPPIPGQRGPTPGPGPFGPWTPQGPVPAPPRRPNPVVRRVVVALCSVLVVLLVAGIGAVLWYTGSLPFGSKLDAQGRRNAALFAGHDDLLTLAKPFLNDVECEDVVPVDQEALHVRCDVAADTGLDHSIEFEAVTTPTARAAQRQAASSRSSEKRNLKPFTYTADGYPSGHGAAWRVEGEVVPTCYLYWDDDANAYATFSEDEFGLDENDSETTCQGEWSEHLKDFLGKAPHLTS